MMCVGDRFAVVCKDVIPDINEQNVVLNSLKLTGHQIIDISLEQMNSFAGNVLQVQTDKGTTVLVMSGTAFDCLTELQVNRLNEHTELLPCAVKTIETIGGGSARCMIAEIFLP